MVGFLIAGHICNIDTVLTHLSCSIGSLRLSLHVQKCQHFLYSKARNETVMLLLLPSHLLVFKIMAQTMHVVNCSIVQ